MINIYLRELVQSNHRVIIPDLGAFLKKDKAANSLESSVTFSPFLRFNDGLVENYLVEKEHITEKEASLEVRRYVQSIKQTIAVHQFYYVTDLGAFYEDERGSVQFLFAKSEKEANRKLDEIASNLTTANATAGMPELDVEESTPAAGVVKHEVNKKKIVKKKAESIIKENKETAQVNADEKAKHLEEASNSLQRWMEEVEKRREQQAQEEKKALEAKEPAMPEELEAQQRRQAEVRRALDVRRKMEEVNEAVKELEANVDDVNISVDNELRVVDDEREEVLVERKEEGEKSKKSLRWGILFWIVLLLLILAAALLWFWAPISNFVGNTPGYTEVVTEEYVITNSPAFVELDSVATDSTHTSAFLEQQEGLYYVVVGVFNIQNNAFALCQKLNNLGLNAEMVKACGDKFVVSIAKSSSIETAKREQDNYKKKYGDAWVLY